MEEVTKSKKLSSYPPWKLRRAEHRPKHAECLPRISAALLAIRGLKSTLFQDGGCVSCGGGFLVASVCVGKLPFLSAGRFAGMKMTSLAGVAPLRFAGLG